MRVLKIFSFVILFFWANQAHAMTEARFGAMTDIRFVELLDKPIKRVSVPAPLLVKTPAGTECSYYSSYMIKQNFIGNPAAESTVLVPSKSAATAKCAAPQFVGQILLPKDLGFFFGIKGDYAFFQGGEADHPSFVVLRLHDQAVVYVGRAQIDPTAHGLQIRKLEIQSNDLVLSYVQSTIFKCSALGAGKKCITKMAKQMHAKNTLIEQKCKTGYQSHLQIRAKHWCRENNPKDPACLINQSKKMQSDNDSASSEIHESVEARIPANAKALKVSADGNALIKKSKKYQTNVDRDFECSPQN